MTYIRTISGAKLNPISFLFGFLSSFPFFFLNDPIFHTQTLKIYPIFLKTNKKNPKSANSSPSPTNLITKTNEDTHISRPPKLRDEIEEREKKQNNFDSFIKLRTKIINTIKIREKERK